MSDNLLVDAAAPVSSTADSTRCLLIIDDDPEYRAAAVSGTPTWMATEIRHEKRSLSH